MPYCPKGKPRKPSFVDEKPAPDCRWLDALWEPEKERRDEPGVVKPSEDRSIRG